MASAPPLQAGVGSGEVTISVVVPAHDVDDYINGTLTSIRCQSARSLEILVIDDASTDRTAAIAAAHRELDRRVRLITLPTNQGVCRARNAGIDQARGRWIAFVDADDWLVPHRLETLAHAAEAGPFDWLADDQLIVAEPSGRPVGRVLRSEDVGARPVTAGHLIRRDPPERIGYGTLKPLVRRSFLERTAIRFRPGFERYEDFLFHVDCGLHGARMGLLGQALYHYRRRPGSLTSATPIRTLERMLDQNGAATAAATAVGNGEVVDALDRRRQLIAQALDYRRLLDEVGRRDLASIAQRLRRTPGVGLTLVDRLSRAAGRRIGLQL